MKDSFLNKIWTVWISNYAVQINKCASNVSKIDQSCVIQSSRQVCYCVSRWHTDILQEQRKSQKACQKSFEKISRKESLFQTEKIWISQIMSWISRTYCHNRKVRNELRENQSSNQIFYVRMCQEHTDISETDRILLKIHYKFCQHHCIIHWSTVKKQII